MCMDHLSYKVLDPYPCIGCGTTDVQPKDFDTVESIRFFMMHGYCEACQKEAPFGIRTDL